MRNDATYFGTGIRFTKGSGGYFQEFTDRELIIQNILQILLTVPGERVMLPEFGSQLRLLKHEPNDVILKQLSKVYIQEAIERWEDRVHFVGVDIFQHEHHLEFILTVEYKFNRHLEKIPVRVQR